MKQKVIKIGSSIGIVIPKQVAEEKGFKAGEEAQLHLEENSNRIIIEPSLKQSGQDINPHILQWTDNFIEKNRELLKRLKEK